MATITQNTFAAACYEQNSIEELKAALSGDADKRDCEIWGLTPDEWRAQIEMAIAELKNDNI